MKKQIVFSGVQPTGSVTIGNYIGAIKNFLDYQSNNYASYFCIVDLHALSGNIPKKEMIKNILNLTKTYIALGLDPKNVTLFQQSQIPAHSELMWLLNDYVGIGQLERMTQYKNKSNNSATLNANLLNYPILMAADIILYNTEIVPIGEDQKQHLELTRDIIEKINSHLDLKIPLPTPIIKKNTAKIYSLSDPSKKMSKSDISKSFISLFDNEKAVEKKIKSAITDSLNTIIFDPIKKPGVSNLMIIYSEFSNLSLDEIQIKYKNNNYGIFKKDLIQHINVFLKNFQTKYNSISDEVAYQILEKGTKKARKIATKNLYNIQKELGLKGE